MTRITYFRVVAFLPILLPTPLTALAYFTSVGETAVGSLTMVLFDSVLVAGLPYLLAAVVALYLLSGHSERAYIDIGVVAPVLFAIILAVFMLLLERSSRMVAALPFVCGLCLLVGYGYVGIAFAGLVIFDRIGVIRDRVVNQPKDE